MTAKGLELLPRWRLWGAGRGGGGEARVLGGNAGGYGEGNQDQHVDQTRGAELATNPH